MSLMTKDGVVWDIPLDQQAKHQHHGWEFVDADKAGEDIIRLKPSVLTQSTVIDREQAKNVETKGDE